MDEGAEIGLQDEATGDTSGEEVEEQVAEYPVEMRHPSYQAFLKSRISFLSPLVQGKNSWIEVDKPVVRKVQQGNPVRPDGCAYDEGDKLWKLNGRIWIPEAVAYGLIIQHHVCMGHASISTEMDDLIRRYVFSVTDSITRQRVTDIHNMCLNCDKFPSLMRRSLRSIPHAKRPNILLHSDFTYVHNGFLCTVVDDFSRKVLLKYARTCTSGAVVEAVSE